MTHGCPARQFRLLWISDASLADLYLSQMKPERARGMTDRELLVSIYDAFNRRDIDTVLATLDVDVDWPNGMEGGRVHGREGVRQYWLRQWTQINPLVEPQSFHTESTGAILVDVRQQIRDLAGNLVADRMVQHVYRFHDGLIQSMEIRETAPKS
jgi:hypothetical protein